MGKKYSLVVLENISIGTAKAVKMSGKSAYFIPPFDILDLIFLSVVKISISSE